MRPARALGTVQGGLLVVQPSAATYAELLAAKNSTISADGSGQGFFTTHWRGRVTWLPSRFNYIQSSKCVALFEQSDGVEPFSADALAQARLPKAGLNAEQLVTKHLQGPIVTIHYHYHPKPWVGCPKIWEGAASVEACRQSHRPREWRWAGGRTAMRPLVAEWWRAFSR